MEKANRSPKSCGMRDLSMTTEGAISSREIGSCSPNKTGAFRVRISTVQSVPKCLASGCSAGLAQDRHADVGWNGEGGAQFLHVRGD